MINLPLLVFQVLLVFTFFSCVKVEEVEYTNSITENFIEVGVGSEVKVPTSYGPRGTVTTELIFHIYDGYGIKDKKEGIIPFDSHSYENIDEFVEVTATTSSDITLKIVEPIPVFGIVMKHYAEGQIQSLDTVWIKTGDVYDEQEQLYFNVDDYYEGDFIVSNGGSSFGWRFGYWDFTTNKFVNKRYLGSNEKIIDISKPYYITGDENDFIVKTDTTNHINIFNDFSLNEDDRFLGDYTRLESQWNGWIKVYPLDGKKYTEDKDFLNSFMLDEDQYYFYSQLMSSENQDIMGVWYWGDNSWPISDQRILKMYKNGVEITVDSADISSLSTNGLSNFRKLYEKDMKMAYSGQSDRLFYLINHDLFSYSSSEGVKLIKEEAAGPLPVKTGSIIVYAGPEEIICNPAGTKVAIRTSSYNINVIDVESGNMQNINLSHQIENLIWK